MRSPNRRATSGQASDKQSRPPVGSRAQPCRATARASAGSPAQRPRTRPGLSARFSAATSSPPSAGDARAADKDDPKSMTLFGELYANGLGVPQNDSKAADWYKLAAARGDANAMFALAMFRMQGAPARVIAKQAPNGSPPRPSSVIRIAAYDLGAALHGRPAFPAGLHPRRRTAAHCGGGRQPARRNMRSARSTKRAAACQRTCRKR